MLAVIHHTVSSGTDTITQIGVIAAAVASITASAVSWGNRKRLQEVHVLVNGNFSSMVEELKTVTAQRDTARTKVDKGK